MSSDWIARSTAGASLVVAICSSVVAYWNYSQQRVTFEEQKRQFELLQSEQLVLGLESRTDGLFKITDANFGSSGRVVQFPWELGISNSGNQKLSIVSYNISSGSKAGSTFYSGIDGGLLTSKGEAVTLPMVLETGESRSLFVLIGIRVPPDVFEILSGIDPGKRTTQQAIIAVGRKGLDLYGNQVDFKELDGSYVLSIASDKQKSPRFWLKVTTGRGNAFVVSASAYDRQQ
jgi:hypothetical protein